MSRPTVTESPVSRNLLFFACMVLVLYFAKVLLIPFAFALTLSFLLLPAVLKLEQTGIRRAAAVTIASTLTGALFLGGTYIVSRQVLNVARLLPGYRTTIEGKIVALHSPGARSLNQAAATIEELSGDLALGPAAATPTAIPVQIVGQRSDQLHASIALIASLLEPFGQLGIVIVFTIYMLMNSEELRHRVLLLAGMGNLNLMTRALDDATRRISQYLVMQLQVNASYGVLFGAGLYLLHVPEATLWGVIAGTLRFVPFVGTLIGVALPLILSVAVSTGWWPPLLVISLFLVLEGTLTNIVEPWLFSSHTGISSLALLGSAIFWSMLWGLPGLVLSTPLTVCVVVLGRHVPQFAFLHSMMGTTARLSPAAHMYERLLAMDDLEAAAIAERYLIGKPLAHLYDAVLIPVLALAEEDRHKGALDALRAEFVLLCLGELVARLGSHIDNDADGTDRSERSQMIQAPRAPLQKEIGAVCIAASDPADDLATIMLIQLLERAGYQALMLRAEALSDEILRGLAAEKDTVLFISALPPFAFAQAKGLCLRVRAHLPENRIAVGLWNSEQDSEEMTERFGTARPNAVLSRLAQAVSQAEVWQRGTRRLHQELGAASNGDDIRTSLQTV